MARRKYVTRRAATARAPATAATTGTFIFVRGAGGGAAEMARSGSAVAAGATVTEGAGPCAAPAVTASRMTSPSAVISSANKPFIYSPNARGDGRISSPTMHSSRSARKSPQVWYRSLGSLASA